ncbi:MAG: HEAT repeat domain-containing protein [Acidobacteriaceae bacterium]|nr:HEAT repeat domain-containing protein [Acidobacteriaceae bacterium]MBV9779073.1 HEAT repeat domain-containing protein [Acidobacteriaceae bacterium]
MTCHEVQTSLSLYLYNELDFAQEEELEQHLSECALCKRALDREKTWHASLNAEQAESPLDLLSECRQELKSAISKSKLESKAPASHWWSWGKQLGFLHSAWSTQIAFASFLVFAGFTTGRLINRTSLLNGNGISEASLLGSGAARVRDIQPSDDHRVRIVVDRVNEQEITGSLNERAIRDLLMAAARDSSDPGIRVDSFEMLKDQSGADVRDALIYAASHDANPGVRLKALQGLGRFANDSATRQSLAAVLTNDDNPAVRSEAIDVLAPPAGAIQVTPELVGTLQEIMRSGQSDDYVRLRCMQLLSQMNALPDAY